MLTTRSALLMLAAPAALASLSTSVPATAQVIPTFVNRMDQIPSGASPYQLQSLGIDPTNLGLYAPPTTLAELTDTNGTLGSISASPTMMGISAQEVTPEDLRYPAKGALIIGSTGLGAIGGASLAGIPTLGIGAIPGAIVGGGFGALAGVGGAILANLGSPPPAPPPPKNVSFNNYLQTEDVTVFSQMAVTTPNGSVNLAAAIENGIMNDPGLVSYALPGGATLFQPGASLFAGSQVLDSTGADVPGSQIDVGLLEAQGTPYVAVFTADPTTPITLTDNLSLSLGNVISPSLLANGESVQSQSIFLQAIVVPETSTLWPTGLGGLLLFAWARRRRPRAG